VESVGPTESSSEHHLETIASVQTGSQSDIASLDRTRGEGFTMEELQKAMDKAGTA
jgi:hypothetical protein